MESRRAEREAVERRPKYSRRVKGKRTVLRE